MNIQNVKIDFRSRLNNTYPTKEIDMFVRILAEDLQITPENIAANVPITHAQHKFFSLALERLQNNEPLQYIRGIADFYGYEYAVNPAVLIPRQETEILVHTLIKDFKGSTPTIVDLCTGSGCIINTLAKELNLANAYGFDISEDALAVAKANAQKIGVCVQFARLDVLSHNAEKNLPNCDVLASNPPYVCQKEREQMHANVLDFEPEIALFVADENPLLFYEAIGQIGQKILNPKGTLICEINEEFGAETKQLFESQGYTNCKIIPDLHEKDRFVQAQKH